MGGMPAFFILLLFTTTVPHTGSCRRLDSFFFIREQRWKIRKKGTLQGCESQPRCMDKPEQWGELGRMREGVIFLLC